ncbi:MAG: 4-hydroxy-3-methylbut-2-enyl diphosphate reductase [Sedimentisphaerales bacterium]|nr:4-hydroxy-3-methylbut-2-enyl diphosphate reductase [Sedimentisphaerales bacterium]
MKVLVAEKCGFCHGVRNAISVAEETLMRHKDGDSVYSLGQIIHNSDEVERLAKIGLKTVDDVEQVRSGTVLIRSHGAVPEQIERLRKKGLNIVDATCVLVKRVQHIAKELAADGYEVVIIGDQDHPEVQAVMGCAKNVVVVADEDDLHNKLPNNARLGIIGQTTQSPEHFGKVLGAIGRTGFYELKVMNTLCKEAIKRQESAVQLCMKVDIMFVLGGLKSANTRQLAELCKKYNKQTFHLQNWKELDKKVLFGKNVAGVTAGASTPDWIIKEFVKKLENINTDNR